MALSSTIELKNLKIKTDIGTYGPSDIVPDTHALDLTLQIDPALVLIDRDGMDRVFDYDPLIVRIGELAADGHYETQERLMTRIIGACAHHNEIEAVEIFLRKSPVQGGSGELGVRAFVDGAHLDGLRRSAIAA